MPEANGNQLGTYLKDRRSKLDPAALGFPMTRRRTPGLRREEVAQRASVSATWYTWLEQGRGGSPSTDVLNRISRALMLTTVEREHLFLIALGHPPEVRYQATEGISPRIQRVLDALEFSPAFVKTVTWDLVAWNRAASALFGHDSLAPEQRNILRRIFLDPQARAAQLDWQSVARFAVAAFRADTVRAGASANVETLVDELRRLSPEFDLMWRDNDVRSHGEGIKQLRHPIAGLLALEYSAFSIDGRPDLSLVIYNPATRKDVNRIRELMNSTSK
ncbi:MAG TPA: helix-turn-helix transcriptional regulator [Chthoniobacterales bacterium]|jgi:transcriptional regulator with XRE-family HTH domain|nr:helix-turn-helix transcriptional regulator [Chthoniobacterales bacterium]